MVKVPRYRAKSSDSDEWFEGYYFEYPETTYCFTSDPTPTTIHCLAKYRMTDWGLPNQPYLVTIDVNTLEEIKD